MGSGEYRHQGEGCRWDGQPWAPSLVFPAQQLLWSWPVSPKGQDSSCLPLQRQDWLPPENDFFLLFKTMVPIPILCVYQSVFSSHCAFARLRNLFGPGKGTCLHPFLSLERHFSFPVSSPLFYSDKPHKKMVSLQQFILSITKSA